MPRRENADFAALPGGPGAQRAVVESTSNWYWLRDLLGAQGVDLRLAHSKHVKAISYAEVKTDAVNAATLALSHGRPRPSVRSKNPATARLNVA